HAPGTVDGFSEPFASSSQDLHKPLEAFDGNPNTVWMPSAADALNSSVGFDFGRASEKPVERARIDWARADLIAPKIEIQYADYGTEWKSAGRFEVPARAGGGPVTRIHKLP